MIEVSERVVSDSHVISTVTYSLWDFIAACAILWFVIFSANITAIVLARFVMTT